MTIAIATMRTALATNKRIRTMNKGYFISFEGGEAAGKTLQVGRLREYIESNLNAEDFLFVREPGGTPLTEELRRLLLNYETDPPLPMSELLLYCAARVEDVHKRILPALEQGKVVIADRFYDSTIAYQGAARGTMGLQQILDLTESTIGKVKPDLTIYLKVAPEVALSRKQKLGNLDRIEKEGLEFYKKVQAGYDFISQKERERFVIIDGEQSPQDISNKIIEILSERLPKQFKKNHQ